MALAFLFPLLAFGGQKACAQREPTAKSYVWNFSSEATGLFGSAESGAVRVRNMADRLAFQPTDSRLSQASQLMEIRHEINDLGAILCRLQTIERVTQPWQRQAIDRTVPQLKAMAGDTQNAIEFLNANPGNLFNPAYREYASNLYQTSGKLATMLKDFQAYGQAKGNLDRLQKTLELRPAS